MAEHDYETERAKFLADREGWLSAPWGDVLDEASAIERLRIAAWLHAKSDETEALLRTAAERGDPHMRPAQLFFATKTRVLIEVLARMVETNTMPLKAKEDE